MNLGLKNESYGVGTTEGALLKISLISLKRLLGVLWDSVHCLQPLLIIESFIVTQLQHLTTLLPEEGHNGKGQQWTIRQSVSIPKRDTT